VRTFARAVRGTATVLLAGTILVTAASTTAYAGDDHGKGNGKASSSSANSDCGEYCSTRDGSPSGNGNGGGEAKGRPCAGCVGNADDKNPKGQRPNGSDSNNGYECDGNSGIARTNPAHTGCTAPVSEGEAPVAAPVETPVETPDEPATVPVAEPVTEPAPVVEGTRAVAEPVAVKAPAEQPEAAVGATGELAPNVLGTRFERPATVSGVAGSNTGTLPFTGDTTGALLLAAVALLGTGAVVARAGAKKA
jgi:hypothetical protein